MTKPFGIDTPGADFDLGFIRDQGDELFADSGFSGVARRDEVRPDVC